MEESKFLGNLLDTTADIARRKTLAINAGNNIQKIFNNKLLTIPTKMNAFTMYVQLVYITQGFEILQNLLPRRLMRFRYGS